MSRKARKKISSAMATRPRTGQLPGSSPQSASRPSRNSWFSTRANFIFGCLLVIATVAAYWPALTGAVLFDDGVNISDNLELRTFEGLRQIWFAPGLPSGPPQYYPLTFSLFWLEHEFWGLHTLGYHFVNVLLHCGSAILLWQVLARLKVRGARLAGAIFALHPVCVMSVAWMTELKNALSAALALGATWAFIKGAKLGVYGGSQVKAPNNDPPDNRYYFLAIGLFLLAMLAKTAVSFLLVTFVLLVWWQRRRLNWRSLWPLLPMLAIVVGMGLITIYVETHSGGAEGSAFKLSPAQRVLVSGRSFWFYLAKLAFPYPLIFLYPRWNVDPAAWWQWLFPLLTAAVLIGAWALRQRIGRGPAAGLLHFFVASSALIFIVVPYFTKFSFVADHWQYFACPAVIALAASGLTKLVEKFRLQNYSTAMGGVLLLALGILTFRQSAIFQNDETLWASTLKYNPDCPQAQTSYGSQLFATGDAAGALEHLKRATELDTNDAELFFNYGNGLAQAGRFNEAGRELQRALEIDPNSGLAHNGMGNVLLRLGRLDDALNEYRLAVSCRPGDASAHYNFGNALAQADRTNDAIDQYRVSLQLNPTNFSALNNLGRLLAEGGRMNEAASSFQLAVKLAPDDPTANNNLGRLLLQMGRKDEALKLAEQFARSHPGDYLALNNYGALLYQAGMLDDSVIQVRSAIRLQPRRPEARATALRIAWRLATSPVDADRNGARALELTQELTAAGVGGESQSLTVHAAALGECGRFDEALAAARQAKELLGGPAQSRQEQILNDEIAAFTARRAYRDPQLARPPASPTAP